MNEDAGLDIAIVGLAGRFPGAPDVARFWQRVMSGLPTTSRFSPDEMAGSVPATEYGRPDYVPVFGVLDDADRFDAGFFGYSPRDARLIDPQQRVFLECAWQALRVGRPHRRYRQSLGRGLRGHRHGRLLAAQPAAGGRRRRVGIRDGGGQRQGRRGDPCRLPPRPARPGHRRADGMLVIPGRRAPGSTGPARRGVRCGAGRRGARPAAAACRLPLRARRDHGPRRRVPRRSTRRRRVPSAAAVSRSSRCGAWPTRWPTVTRSMPS